MAVFGDGAGKRPPPMLGALECDGGIRWAINVPQWLPSATCLCYLFADQVVKPLTRFQKIAGVPGVSVPGSEQMVPLGILEQELLAIAIWSLEASHHITLLFRDEKDGPEGWLDYHPAGVGPLERLQGWFSGKPYIGETVILRRNRAKGSLRGLEGELFNAMDHYDSDIRRLVRDLWMRGESLKINEVVVIPEREAVAASIMRRTAATGCRPLSLAWSESLPDYAADLERLNALAASFSQVHESITRYARSDPNLWRRLVADCGDAIGRPKPRFRVPNIPTGNS